jgi:predicted metal-dependent phosphotriesterase family hydrolase
MSGTSRFNRRQVISLLALGAGLGAREGEEGAGVASAAQARPRIDTRIPKGAVIRTILKDVPPDALGNGAALMHEHVTAGGDVNVLVDEVRASGQEGVSCLVDAAIGKRRPGALEDLRTIATRSGVHIVAAGGYYKSPYPPEVVKKSEEELADELSRDAIADRWGALGEIGTSLEMTADERKMLRAVSVAHKRTGLPIFTHTEHVGCRQCALEQLDVLQSQGVQPQDLAIGHMSDILDDPTAEAHKAVARRGVFVAFDTVGHQMLQGPKATDALKVKLILAMLEAGLEDYVLLASDFAHQQCLKSTWGAGYSTVVTVFVPKLRYAGVKEPTIRKMLVDNPRRFLAFVPKTA